MKRAFSPCLGGRSLDDPSDREVKSTSKVDVDELFGVDFGLERVVVLGVLEKFMLLR
jgi:hypothetical protein